MIPSPRTNFKAGFLDSREGGNAERNAYGRTSTGPFQSIHFSLCAPPLTGVLSVSAVLFSSVVTQPLGERENACTSP